MKHLTLNLNTMKRLKLKERFESKEEAKERGRMFFCASQNIIFEVVEDESIWAQTHF